MLRGSVAAAGGGLFLTTNGAGVAHEVDISSATLTDNQVLVASGVGGGLVADGFTLRLRGTILHGNMAATGPQCSGAIDSSGYDLFESQAGCTVGSGTGDLGGVDPSLGALAANGGPTRTRAIDAGGAAHEGGDPAGCSDHLSVAFMADQRGLPRPVGRCDIGAFELQP